MAKHGSASPRKGTSTPRRGDAEIRGRGDGCSTPRSHIIDASLKRRARKLANDSRVDPGTRSLIRYGLEIKDQHLQQVVNRVEAGEMNIDHIYLQSD